MKVDSRVAQRKSNRLITDRSTFRNCPWLPRIFPTVAQLVERQPEELCVIGSSPIGGTNVK